jgi:hypothetical protein
MAAADIRAPNEALQPAGEVWRKLHPYGTVPLGNSRYLLPADAASEERLQRLATTIRKYGGDASVVRVHSIDNISTPKLVGWSPKRAPRTTSNSLK